jgi:hypothetical protein
MSIYVPVIFVSILYYAIGYFINKENAKYLLTGYNTMSDEERKKFDIENYLVFFKAFFKKQSVYSLLVFPVLHLMFDDEKAILIWSLYITIAIVYLYIKSKKFYY